MGLLNADGSTTALSMAADMDPTKLIPMATAAGVLITVGAVIWTYEKWEVYTEKKHLEEIAAVNTLYQKHLEKIKIVQNKEIRGFPPIFKLTQNEKSSSVDSLHLTDDEIEAIGSTTPQVDNALTKYQELVLAAILKLKDYYLDRKNKDHKDVTSGVLAYLLYMLEKKCLTLEGYNYDIAYLQALAKFISAYASLSGTENSQHFERLNPVRGYLLAAKQELEKHQKALSLEGMINELNNFCVNSSKNLLRTFAKFITQQEKWRYVKTATFDEMSKGILRKKYAHTQVRGLKVYSDSQINIPTSDFKNWLIWLLAYFEKSINANSPMTIEEIMTPEKLFNLPNLNRLEELEKKSIRSKEEKIELENLKDKLKSISNIFSECDNFVAMELSSTTATDTPKFIHVGKDRKKLIERATMLAEFATLIHKTISLEYLCVHLLNSLKQLGDISMRNPHHYSLIFSVLEGICNDIKQSADKNTQLINDIRAANQNIGRLVEQELFPEETLELLNSISATVTRLGQRVKIYRDESDPFTQPIIDSVKHAMFEVAAKLAMIYNLHHSPVSTSDDSASEPPSEHSNSCYNQDTFQLRPSPSSIAVPPFWEAHKYKFLGAVVIAFGVLCMLTAIAISFFSAGTLSPFGAMLGGFGVKLGVAGVGLITLDAVFGLVSGVIVGSLVDGAIVASVVIRDCVTTHALVQNKLSANNRSHPLSNAMNDVVVNTPEPRMQPPPPPNTPVDTLERSSSQSENTAPRPL